MTDRNWEAELAKIDKQLASVSDEKLLTERAPLPAAKGAPSPKTASATTAPARAAAPATATGTWRGWIQVLIATGAAAGMMFWPWPGRCGWPLIGFAAASGVVALLGAWSAVGTWRHRLGIAHVASLLVIVWGVLLGAREVLPRVGYAIPTAERGAGWACEAGATAPILPGAVPTSPTVTPPSDGTPGTPQG